MNNINPFLRYQWILEKHLHKESFQILWRNWLERTRYYHGITHLGAVLAYLEKWAYRFTQDEYEKLILAAFFHDAIYDPKKFDNEDRSINLFKRSYSGKDDMNLVIEAIECTKGRKRPTNFLLKTFWNADNDIFKKGWKDYLKYEDGIRKEYAYVSDDIYIKNRVKFLETNLGLFGVRADTNIKRLIKEIGDK